VFLYKSICAVEYHIKAINPVFQRLLVKLLLYKGVFLLQVNIVCQPRHVELYTNLGYYKYKLIQPCIVFTTFIRVLKTCRFIEYFDTHFRWFNVELGMSFIYGYIKLNMFWVEILLI